MHLKEPKHTRVLKTLTNFRKQHHAKLCSSLTYEQFSHSARDASFQHTSLTPITTFLLGSDLVACYVILGHNGHKKMGMCEFFSKQLRMGSTENKRVQSEIV